MCHSDATRNPRILDVENLLAVARLLNGVQIEYSDFTAIEPFVDDETFVSFDSDPKRRGPISEILILNYK